MAKESIHLPGEFFQPSSENFNSNFLTDLKQIVNKFQPQKASNHSSQKPFINKDLFISDYVWIRNDATHPPLTYKYNGPYKVIDRKEKYFKILIKNKEDTVSIDRLKPVYMENENINTFELSEHESTIQESIRKSITFTGKGVV